MQHAKDGRSGWARRTWGWLSRHPASFFCVASLVLGAALVAAAPPLRGPDESAHFLRAYGVGSGHVLASAADQEGRKGVHLPAPFAAQFQVFFSWEQRNRGDDFSYRQAFDEYHQLKLGASMPGQRMFVPYGGSEGYSPAAYLPQAGAAALSHAAGLGFLETIYLMRLGGLLASTAVLAYAIAITPTLKWPFVAVCMLPSSLYGRAVINADAAALAYSLVVVAQFLRTVTPGLGSHAAARSVWLCLCTLAKPPNAAFALLEWLAHRRLRRAVVMGVLVTGPAMAAAAAWTHLSAADAGTWRLVELTGTAPEQFTVGWKLHYLISHPDAFLRALWGWFAKTDAGEFGRQVIGVLGLFDTVLRPWLYPAIGILLIAAFVARLHLPMRARCATAALLTALGYAFAVFLILYIVWTPVQADMVWGVQGRYFVPALPLIAVALAAALPRGLSEPSTAVIVVVLSLLSAAGSLDAILRTDWNF